MANRYTRVGATEFDDIELFQPNFGEIDQMLAMQQAEYDGFNKNKERATPHHTKDAESVSQFQKDRNKRIDDVSNVFLDKGVQAGNRALKDEASRIERDYKPGGQAHAYDQRLAQYEAEAKRLREHFKEQPQLQNWDISRLGSDEFFPVFSFEGGVAHSVRTVSDLVSHLTGNKLPTQANTVSVNI